MSEFFEGLERRRVALVERSAAQRGEVATAVAGLRRAASAPMVIGAGLAVTLLTTSPRLRTWAVRGWATYAFVRQLLGR